MQASQQRPAHIIEDTVPPSWRDVLPVHPAAELFPPLSAAELKVLADDIKARGLLARPVVWFDGECEYLIDGRNRFDALALAGLLTLEYHGQFSYRFPDGSLRQILFQRADRDDDPYDLVLSLNIYRRHLTAEQRRELIAKVLKAKPETSNRQIAKQVKVDDKTVAKVRTELEARSEIPNVDKRPDTKGRKQPAHKKRVLGKAAGSLIDRPLTSEVEAKPSKRDHLNALAESWKEVSAQIASGNRTALKAALARHLHTLKVTCAALEVVA